MADTVFFTVKQKLGNINLLQTERLLFKKMIANLKSKMDDQKLPKLEHDCQVTNPQNLEPKFRFAFNWLGESTHVRVRSAVTTTKRFETLDRG